MKPDKCAENVYLVYRKENVLKIGFSFCFYAWSCWFFWEGRRNVWGQSQQYMSYFDDVAIFTHRRNLAWTIQHVFSDSHQNCSEIVSVDKIMGNKMNVMIGQRISRSGKSRWKWDFLPLHHNASFFSVRGNLKMRLHCPNFICSSVHGYKPWLERAYRRQSAQCLWTTIFSGYFFFFYYSKHSEHVFSLWITRNLYQQHIHMQMNEFSAVLLCE